MEAKLIFFSHEEERQKTSTKQNRAEHAHLQLHPTCMLEYKPWL